MERTDEGGPAVKGGGEGKEPESAVVSEAP